MPNIGDSERKTQNRVVKFFRDKLHYTYLGNLHDSENRNIMPERLHAWLLKQGYSEKLAANAIDALVKTSTNLQQGLYHACLLYTSPSPRDMRRSRMPSSA